jgi:hypothetical protein
MHAHQGRFRGKFSMHDGDRLFPRPAFDAKNRESSETGRELRARHRAGSDLLFSLCHEATIIAAFAKRPFVNARRQTFSGFR